MNVRRSLGTTAASQTFTSLIQFASVIVVSRLLTPQEIGIFSVAAALLGIAQIFRDFGVSQYLIQSPDISHARLRAAFTITLAASWLIAALLVLIRLPAASFYGHSGVADILLLVSVNFILLPFGAPILAVLRRRMQFDRIAVVNISNALISTTVTITAATMGASYLSMAIGAVAGMVSNVAVLHMLRGGDPLFMWPTTSGLKDVLRFGSLASGGSILGELRGSAPDLILGRTLGFSDVAFYSRSNGIRQMAVRQILALVRSVYVPAFANQLRSGNDGAEVYALSVSYLVAITAPLLAVLAVVAEPLIVFLFGAQWTRSADLASLMCISSALLTPMAMASPALTAGGRPDLVLRAETWLVSVRIAALSTSYWLSLEQVVVLLVALTPVELYVFFRALSIGLGLRAITLWRSVRSAIAITVLSIAGPVLVVWFPPSSIASLPVLVQLAASALTATIGWLVAVFALGHPLKAELRNLGLRLIQRRR